MGGIYLDGSIAEGDGRLPKSNNLLDIRNFAYSRHEIERRRSRELKGGAGGYSEDPPCIEPLEFLLRCFFCGFRFVFRTKLPATPFWIAGGITGMDGVVRARLSQHRFEKHESAQIRFVDCGELVGNTKRLNFCEIPILERLIEGVALREKGIGLEFLLEGKFKSAAGGRT